MKKGQLRRILTIMVAFMLLLALPLKVNATDDNGVNEAVNEDKKGVICILVEYRDDADNLIPVQSGTGFLINDETVITCNHVVVFDEDTIAYLMETYEKKESEVKAAMQIRVIINRDVAIDAKVQNFSAEMDYAILHLEEKLFNRTFLKLRHSSEVIQTETVYALGFPGQIESTQDVNTYTTDDVTVTRGQVSKISRLADNVDYVMHSAGLNSGHSGGPLVDNNGAVIGINAMKLDGDFDASYYYAIAIDQLITTMDYLGVEYTLWEAPVTEEPSDEELAIAALQTEIENAKALEPSDYTKDSFAEVERIMAEAEELAANTDATPEQIEEKKAALTGAVANLVEASHFPWLLIGIIAGVAAVLIVIILIVVMKGKGKGKKKAAPKYSATPSYSPLGNPANNIAGQSGRQINGFDQASANPATNFFGSGGDAGETSVLNAGAGETTVLNDGAGETTLLRGGISLGTLTRTRNGERITISDNFVIGKERSKVDYWISDNTSVSRTHVRFTAKGGTTYITDLKTTNGTFLNGVMIQPGQEKPLKNGDHISLADEEFSYTV